MENKNNTNTKNIDHIDWDTYFMGVALLSNKRSKDPNTRVGACIVNTKKRIVGIGYNGFPYGCDDDKFPWANHAQNYLDNKYPYVVHAEANAILNANGPLDDCTVYVSLFPCNECAKLIIQSGIKHIVYMDDKYDGTESDIASKKMLDAAKVDYRKMKKIEIEIRDI
jgi:dCMP deaminase